MVQCLHQPMEVRITQVAQTTRMYVSKNVMRRVLRLDDKSNDMDVSIISGKVIWYWVSHLTEHFVWIFLYYYLHCCVTIVLVTHTHHQKSNHPPTHTPPHLHTQWYTHTFKNNTLYYCTLTVYTSRANLQLNYTMNDLFINLF